MSQSDQPTAAIAVIGLAGRFPRAENIEVFWQNLRNGVEAVSFFNDEELQVGGVGTPESSGRFVKARAILEGADKFDADFFGIKPKEAEIMDPQHRLFLECAWEALEDGGYGGKRDDRLVGVYAGMSMNTYLLENLWSRPDVIDLVGSYQIMLSNDKDYLPTLVSYKLNLRGPSVNIQTACSTSLVAVCVACEQLLNYQCDMALAGGVSVTFPQKRGYLYQEGGISSPDGHCRAFDAKAQGTVPGDGVGIVLLKRLSDAIEDGDHVYAVIKGFATNNDGSMKAGFTAPSSDGQAEVIALAQAVAGIDPGSIGYVVAHGTGTPVGDPIEIEGLTKAFRAGTDGRQFCAVTSVKTNIGHLDAAAGIAGLINAVLAIHHHEIPPCLHFESPNPKIDLANSPFFINKELRKWTSSNGTVRRAAVRAFGIGGTNAHVVLEEAPTPPRKRPARNAHLLVLSARSDKALAESTERLAARLEKVGDGELADVAYTLATGRSGFPKRRAVVSSSAGDAVTTLRTLDPNFVTTGSSESRPPVVFMFPGQGAQYVNMGLGLYQTEPVFREQIDLCSKYLKSRLGFDLREVLYPAPEQIEPSAERLLQTAVAQPALFSIEHALAQLWMSWGIAPDYFIGHSIGEYVAACLAGVFSLTDGLELVALRGALMQSCAPGAMLAIRLPDRELEKSLPPDVSLAAVNSPGNSVVSGPSEVIEKLAQTLGEKGIVAKRLRTSHAFHSAMMDPIRSKFVGALKRIHLRDPKSPYISNLTGSWITAEQATNPTYWADHLRHPVRFADGISELLKQSPLVLLECGPGRTLGTLVRQHPARGVTHAVAISLPSSSTGDAGDHAAILSAAGQMWVSGVDPNWSVIYGEGCRRVPLPTYPFERQRYWVEPGRTNANPNATVLVPQPASQTRTDLHPICSNGAVPAEATSIGSDLIGSSLKSLFSQLSGLSVANIDSRTSFTELGFDSLFLTQVSQAIEKQFAVKIPFGQLLDKFSTLDSLTKHLCGRTVEMVERTSPPRPADGPETDSISDAEGRGLASEAPRAALTEAQREIWFGAQHGRDASCVFNESNMLWLRGDLDIDHLRAAIQQVIERHESLRTTFSPDGDFQEVKPDFAIQLPLLDFSAEEPEARQTRLEALLREEARTPFELSRGPLIRAQLVCMEPRFHIFVVTVHHLVCDGASLGIIFKELSDLYSAARREMPCHLPTPLRFVDYARRQNVAQDSEEKRRAEKYWIDQFSVLPPALELPLDFPRSSEVSFAAGWEDRPLKTSLCRELSRVSAQQKTTLFVTFLASYYIFLSRLSGQEEVVVGVPMADRSKPGDEKLVGQCINFLPLRSRVTGAMRFADYLAEVRTSLLTALEHQNYTFGTLVQKLQLPRDRTRTPLLSATFNMVWVRTGLNFSGLEVEVKPNPDSFSNFDLTFNVTETDGTFALDCSYKSDLLSGTSIRRWLSYFETLLEEIATNPDQQISRFSLIPKSERDELLAQWNETRADYPRDAMIHQLVEAQAKRTPDAPAIAANSTILSYRELVTRADQLAVRLRRAGVKPDESVAVCTQTASETVIAMLGILKAGGAIIILSGSAATHWNRAVLNRATFLLGTEECANQIRRFSGTFLPLDAPQLASTDTDAPVGLPENLSAENTALIVPSGTATDLKLTAFSHRALVNVLSWLMQNLPLGPGAKTMQLKTPGTEPFAREIFLTLCNGGCLLIPNLDINADENFAATIGRERPDRVLLSGAQFAIIANAITTETADLHSLREIIVHASRPLQSADLASVRNKLPNCFLLVLYGNGPTGIATALRLNGSVPIQPRAPIGQPIPNVQVLILDAELNPVPNGIPGRLFVGGDSIARGSLNGPVERSPGSATDVSGTRPLIDTGDLARYLADGNIELLTDSQSSAELGDWNIDLQSVQRYLARRAGIKEAFVTIRDHPSAQEELVLYVVPQRGDAPMEADVLEAVSEQLPSIEIPTTVVSLEQLPKTTTGEIDQRRLPLPGQTGGAPRVTVAPRTPTQKLLAQIWCEVIGLDEVGIHDDFFDLGGHSILVTQIVSRIRKIFDIDIGLQPIFESATIAQLSVRLERILTEQIESLAEEEALRLTSESALISKNAP